MVKPLSRWIAAALEYVAVGAAAVALIASLVWLALEPGWTPRAETTPRDAFEYGTLGLETVPLKLALVLQETSGRHFNRRNEDRDWLSSFGFLRRPNPKHLANCIENAREVLPVGFGVSRFVPNSAAVSPVEFAGLTCAACHSTRIHTREGIDTGPIIGAGAISLDLIAWGDALQSAVADPNLNASLILAKYDAQCPSDEGLMGNFVRRPLETLLIDQWIAGFRATTLENATKYDPIHQGPELLDRQAVPPGPSRTRPFRSVVRNSLGFSGYGNDAYSKVPSVFLQDVSIHPFSQYDGSINDPVVRSLVAAFTSDSSKAALASDAVVANIRGAAAFTADLGSPKAANIPRFADVFASSFPAPSPERLAVGRDAYMKHCNTCHGHATDDGLGWSGDGAEKFKLIDPIPGSGPEALNTDPARLNFRFAAMLAISLYTNLPGAPGDALDDQQAALGAALDRAAGSEAGYAADPFAWQYWKSRELQLETDHREFPTGHPLAFGKDVIKVQSGYLNGPISHPWLRAPYLHNGSVPTMRQLLNLDARPPRFCRGDNFYDPSAMGLDAPEPAGETCPQGNLWFIFDTQLPGNSAAGHNFPWTHEEIAADPAKQAELEALIDYLRTL